jgi:hypothetical protein
MTPGAALPDQRAPCRHVRPELAPSSYAMEKLVVTLLVCPRNEQVTVAVPPVPDDCMYQVHPTTPLRPTVRAEPSNDCGPSPVE